MTNFSVAVIGTGAMGKSHVRVYSKLESVSLTAICDADKHRCEELAKEYNTNSYDSCAEMLKNEQIDAVSICVPTKYHKDIALQCIEAGVHVLVEKPIATTVAEAQEIIAAAKKKNVTLMIGHIERFNPVVQELKKRLQQNELGEIYKAQCLRLSPFPQRIVDVGVITDLAVHDIDVLMYLLESPVEHVFAETAKRIHSSHEDLLIGTLRFKNNVLGVINSNWLTPKKVREITITGEKGMFVANYLTQKMFFYENDFVHNQEYTNNSHMTVIEGPVQEIAVANQEPLKNELSSFISFVQKGEPAIVTGEEGLSTLHVAQQLKASAEDNQVKHI